VNILRLYSQAIWKTKSSQYLKESDYATYQNERKYGVHSSENTIRYNGNMNKKIIVVSSVIIFIIICLLLRVTLKKTSIDGEVTVEVVSVAKGELKKVYETEGIVERYILYSENASFSGNIIDVLVEDGQSVCKGDTLINFDNSNEQVALKMAEYEYALACDNYENAVLNNSTTNENAKNLSDNKREIQAFISSKQKEYEQLQLAYIDAKTSLGDKNKELIDLQSQIQSASVSGNDLIDINEIEDRIKQINKDIIDIELSLESHNISINNLLNELSLKQSELSIIDNNIYTNEQAFYSEYELDALNIQKMIALIKKEQCDATITLLNNGILAEQEGVISNLDVEENFAVVRGQHLFDIVSESKRKAVVYLPCDKLNEIKINDIVSIFYIDKEYKGKIEKIADKAELLSTGENVVRIEILIENESDVLIEGVNVDVEIVTNVINNALLIPVTTIKSDRKGDFVYVVNDRIIEKRYITTGIICDNNVEILEGLQEGEDIVSNCEQALNDGEFVSIEGE